MRIQLREQLGQQLGGRAGQILLRAFVAQEAGSAEDHRERLVDVGIDEAQPAADFGARAGAAIAQQLALRRLFGNVFQDGDVLRQGPVAIGQRGHGA
ncbi:hypothetical protein D3C73_1249310 [compost metagenome]